MDQIAIDVRIANIAMSGIMLILSVTLFAVQWQHKTIKGLMFWGMAYVAGALTMNLQALRGDISDFYSVLMANYFHMATYLLFYYGCIKYTDKNPKTYFVLLITVIFWAPFLVIYQSPEYFGLRVILASFGQFALCILTAHILITSRRVENLTQKIQGGLFIALGMMSLFRGVWFVFEPVVNVDLLNGALNTGVSAAAYMFVSGVVPVGLVMLIAVCFIVMVTEHLRIELETRVQELDVAKNTAENARIEAEISKSKTEESRKLLEIASNEKTAFLANMSHEIRTPLNAIIGFTEAMLIGVGGKVSSEKHTQYLIDIKESGKHLSTVINDVLDLSKIESGKWVLSEKWFSLEYCVNSVFKMLSNVADQKEITLRYEEDETSQIFGDENAFKRIFINLLSNSIKFSPINTTIHCSVNNWEDGCLKVTVIDSGKGIPEDRINDILKPFVQNHNEYQLSDEGTGLGLPIVKNLVELNGGKFMLESEVDVGTEAIFIMPNSRVRIK